MAPTHLAIVHDADHFSHEHACRIFNAAMNSLSERMVVVDLTRAQEATTSAFARLVLLRRALLQSGRDLRIAGLRDQAAHLYEVNRLETVLPRHAEGAMTGQERPSITGGTPAQVSAILKRPAVVGGL